MANTAAVMNGLNSSELQDLPAPEPGPGQRVLRAEAACGGARIEALSGGRRGWHWKDIAISMVNRYNDTWPLNAALASSGQGSLHRQVTHEFPLAQTAAAPDHTSTGPRPLEAMTHPRRT